MPGAWQLFCRQGKMLGMPQAVKYTEVCSGYRALESIVLAVHYSQRGIAWGKPPALLCSSESIAQCPAGSCCVHMVAVIRMFRAARQLWNYYDSHQ